MYYLSIEHKAEVVDYRPFLNATAAYNSEGVLLSTIPGETTVPPSQTVGNTVVTQGSLQTISETPAPKQTDNPAQTPASSGDAPVQTDESGSTVEASETTAGTASSSEEASVSLVEKESGKDSDTSEPLTSGSEESGSSSAQPVTPSASTDDDDGNPLLIVVIIAVVAVLAFVGYRLYANGKKKPAAVKPSPSAPVTHTQPQSYTPPRRTPVNTDRMSGGAPGQMAEIPSIPDISDAAFGAVGAAGSKHRSNNAFPEPLEAPPAKSMPKLEPLDAPSAETGFASETVNDKFPKFEAFEAMGAQATASVETSEPSEPSPINEQAPLKLEPITRGDEPEVESIAKPSVSDLLAAGTFLGTGKIIDDDDDTENAENQN